MDTQERPYSSKVRRKRYGSAMRRENTSHVSMGTEHPEMSEDANLSSSYTPGKKGGNFGLPLGAKLSVPEALCGKKDYITCTVLSPSQRWRECPQLPPREHITSECFVMTSSMTTIKKPIIVQLPFYSIDWEHNELNVKGRWKDELDWIDIGFLKKEDTTPPCIELELTKLGAFMVTFIPKREMFEVTTQGCLYNARLNRHISIRFPKKGIDQNIQCALQIMPIPPEKILVSKGQFPLECQDLVSATQFIDIIPSVHPNFRRPATVKLPLPAGVEVEGDDGSEIAVLHKVNDSWSLVETHYKFTRTSVSCDVKHLSRFCVCQTKPERQQTMQYAISVLETRTGREKGDVVVFLSIKEKSWKVLVECIPESKAESMISKRSSSGFVLIKKQEKTVEVETKFFSNRRIPPPKRNKPTEVQVFELYDGLKWTIDFQEDIKVGFESDFHDNRELKYFKYLPESYRSFIIEPRNNEEKSLCGVIELKLSDDTKDDDGTRLIFNVNIDEDAVRAYFKPDEPIVEPEPEKPKVSFNFNFPELQPIKEVVKPEAPPPIKTAKTMSPEVMERLMRLPRRVKIVERESRILSGKSLMNLARVVPEGLTLAVHLDLPDSTITGLGFDAISNGLGMADVTYKILLYWKRRLKNKRDDAVHTLSLALRDMGKEDVADLVLDRHAQNKEITADCFEIVML